MKAGTQHTAHKLSCLVVLKASNSSSCPVKVKKEDMYGGQASQRRMNVTGRKQNMHTITQSGKRDWDTVGGCFA